MADTTPLIDGLFFAEGLRWREGRLWFSDFYDHLVRTVDLDGVITDVVEVPGQPSGLGWLPDGRLLVVSGVDERVMRLEPDGRLVEHADVSELASFWSNDMVVDSAGRAYVGDFGFDLDTFLEEHGIEGVLGDPGPTPTVVALVAPDGSVEVAAEQMMFPNGSVITPDGRTLIVAETLALRLTAFDIDPRDGRLSNRRVWADLSAAFVAPDGIALAPDGCVWVANAVAAQAVCVTEGGAITRTIATSQTCFCVELGGPGGDTLFCATAPTANRHVAAAERRGRIEIVRL